MDKVKGILLFVLLCSFAFASGDYLLGPDGKHLRIDKDVKAITEKLGRTLATEKPTVALRADDFVLRWADGGDIVNFGFSTQESGVGDSMAIWMVPLAGCIVKKVLIYDVNFEGKFEIFLHESNYAGEVTTGACANAAGWVGLYLDADGEPCDPDEGDECTWSAGDNECFDEPPIGPEIWPGMDIGGYEVALTADDANSWVTLDFAATLGVSDSINAASFFIDAHATRTEGWGIGALNAPVTPYHGFKYYEEPGTSGNPGWHIRTYGWMVYAMVEYYEDIPPFILDFTKLPTTLSEEARTVEATVVDENPTGGSAGVASVVLSYSVDGGTAVDVTMTVTSVDSVYTGDIAGASPGEEVEYSITATDVGGNSATSPSVTYRIYKPDLNAGYLLLLDGLSGSGYPSLYYFYDAYGLWGKWWTIPSSSDMWAFGDATSELLDLYETVIEITSGGPISGNAVAVKAWLDDGSKNYILAGDEAAGGYFGWPGAPVDMDTSSEDAAPFFQYLGVETYYGDINYAASGDQLLPWPLTATADGLPAGELGTLADAFADMLPDTAELLYDPAYEISGANWLDAFDVDATVTTAFTSIPRGGSGYDSTTALPVGFYKEDATLGNKVMFLGFDPLSLNSDPYIWWGATPWSPLVSGLHWMEVFDLEVDGDVVQLPKSYKLHQNYPNPFNPVTTIDFEMPSDGHITLSIYNLLGQKIATLVNDVRTAGSHSVTWNGLDELGRTVATGVYMYRIDAGDYTATKKMVLLK